MVYILMRALARFWRKWVISTLDCGLRRGRRRAGVDGRIAMIFGVRMPGGAHG